MSLHTEHQKTVAELKAVHGRCFNSEYREFKSNGFVFHYQFIKPVASRSKTVIKRRLDSFSIKAKLSFK